MQRKDFLKYAYMRRKTLKDLIERCGDVLDIDRLNTEYQALDLLLMICKKEVEEIEEELLNKCDEKKAQERKRVFERNSKDDYIYKDLERAVNKKCYFCNKEHDIYYHKSSDLFLCTSCERRF